MGGAKAMTIEMPQGTADTYQGPMIEDFGSIEDMTNGLGEISLDDLPLGCTCAI